MGNRRKTIPFNGGLFLPIFSSSARDEFFEISRKFISNCSDSNGSISNPTAKTSDSCWSFEKGGQKKNSATVEGTSRFDLRTGLAGTAKKAREPEERRRARKKIARSNRPWEARRFAKAARALSADGDSLSTFSIGAERFRARSQSLRRGPWSVIYIPVARATRREGWQRRSNPNKGKKGVQSSSGAGVGLF